MSDLLKEDLNLAVSSISLSDEEDNFSSDDDEEDREIRRMLAEEIINFNLVGSLPPTPRPASRASSVSSLSSISSASSKRKLKGPVPGSSNALRASKRANENEIEGDEHESDDEIRRMLAEEITNFKMVGSLPPTPKRMGRTSSLSSLSSISSISSKKMKGPVPGSSNANRTSKRANEAKGDEHESDDEIRKMLAEEMINFKMVGSLPPTPKRMGRTSSLSSLSSISSISPKKLIGLVPGSSNALKASKEGDQIESDEEIRRMLAEEINNFKMVGSLPPTPRPLGRGRTSSLSSLSSNSSSPEKAKRGHVPVPCKNFRATDRDAQKRKQTERDIFRDFGIGSDDPDFEALADDKEEDEKTETKPELVLLDEGVFVKPKSKPKPAPTITAKDVVDDILMEMGLSGNASNNTFKVPRPRKNGKKPKKAVKVKSKPVKSSTKLDKRWTDLRFTPEARCAVLKEDVETVRRTKKSIDAIIAVLEKTKQKLINDDENLVYTEPPFRIQKQDKVKIDIKKKANS